MEILNIGQTPNDGRGDTLREASRKVNDNFALTVVKVAGKSLSQEDFTTALKAKLSTMEGSHFKGVHDSLAALETASPAANAEPGSYGYIKTGTTAEKLAMLDGGAWVEMSTGSGPLTAAQIKSLYESNANTNAFTDAMISALTGISFDTAKTLTKLDQDIEVPKQALNPDPAATAADNRLITISNAFSIELALKQFVEQHFMPMLDKDNPTMKMHVSAAGTAAQMQVINDDTGHDVATMSWNKTTKSFSFMLADPATGVQKADFEIKLDGKAYVGGKELVTLPVVEKTIREFRTTVEHNIANHAKPTIDECKAAFKLLPHFDWKKDDDFYIKDSTGGKLVLIKYRSTPAATEASPGNFFYEVLTAAV